MTLSESVLGVAFFSLQYQDLVEILIPCHLSATFYLKYLQYTNCRNSLPGALSGNRVGEGNLVEITAELGLFTAGVPKLVQAMTLLERHNPRTTKRFYSEV